MCSFWLKGLMFQLFLQLFTCLDVYLGCKGQTNQYKGNFDARANFDAKSASDMKFRQASNCSKRICEAAKLAYANKTKESVFSQSLGSYSF